jgi:hypothetical protein
MKKVVMTLALMLSMNSAFTQNKAVINHCVNNSEIYSPNGVICSNENRTKWFTVTPNYKLDEDRLSCKGLVVIKSNIGDVNKTGTLVFIFKDGNKIKYVCKNPKDGYFLFAAFTSEYDRCYVSYGRTSGDIWNKAGAAYANIDMQKLFDCNLDTFFGELKIEKDKRDKIANEIRSLIENKDKLKKNPKVEDKVEDILPKTVKQPVKRAPAKRKITKKTFRRKIR